MYVTPQSHAYLAESEQYLACGVSSGIRKSALPLLFFESGEGPYYIDVDGNRYVDYTLAWGPLILGSNHPALNEAVQAQLPKSYTFGAQHKLEIDLAKRMVDVIPGIENVIFSNTGTEAVQAALRIARAKTGKTKIVKFEGHYHGWDNNILVSYRPTREQLGTTVATCGGQPESEFSDTIVLPWNDSEALKSLLEEQGDTIACVLTEPILANSGCCMPEDGFLESVIDLCRHHNVVSIFDEVITGFRIALGGAREYFGLTPDLSVYAKAMAGGFTMSAVGGSRAMFDVLRDGRTLHAGTYNGTSINVAAALATINTLAKSGSYDRMHSHGEAIRRAIETSATQEQLDLVTTGVGSVFGVHFNRATTPQNYTDLIGADTETYSRFRSSLLKRGVHVLPDGRWYVGAVHSRAELDLTTAAIASAMQEIKSCLSASC